ncbi:MULTISPECIES: hypothetical protein [Sphingobacterium]|uniref:Uncharacterized protein n=1 Tax=Sphingobacterium litopenaei TaxID=2763500 RepID=A0ABR7YIY8_9SPHI|nr:MULTISPECIES: hypothetical protein [Sphingobacterium]MBD1431158.1 hypothetical protein [Sphingobacterium litopenaei]NGM74836.1 hypothetical protein [Sphingobacterium sp. SGL-16]
MKLTPLNIALAVILVWVISEWQFDQEMIFTWGWLIIWIVVVCLVDLAFRLIFKDLKQIWFLQIAFILIVGMLMIILKLQ